MAEPSLPEYGPPAVAVGLTFATVTPASSETMCAWPSFTVRVTVKAPSSLQVNVGWTIASLLKPQVVPASTAPLAA